MNSIAAHSLAKTTSITRTLRVRGLVQGVGFRPTVWRIANEIKLAGNVLNDGEGILINLFASEEQLTLFTQQLQNECPKLACIDHIEIIQSTENISHSDFKIIKSQDTHISTGIIADAATCKDCLQELNTPNDNRHAYPFINCTHCGPRFSIIKRIPYDRKNTSMANFKLCQHCLTEYENPADRRFHAQPTACEKCGPELILFDNKGCQLKSINAIKDFAQYIKDGYIVAIKGIGGIHLACDSHNKKAVEELRLRKNRPHKPLAMMAKNISQINQYCSVNNIEKEALNSSAAPIVILDALTADFLLPEAISPQQKQWGFMLPYSPLHHLLMAELDNPIVLTSGNLSDEPQCIDNKDALNRLSKIADYFLLHNRDIENRIDDSVVRRMHNKIQVLRRARGFAPGQISIPKGFKQHPEILALGGELKNTFCLLKNGRAILSQHMGDLEDARTFHDFQKNIKLYLNLYQHKPDILVCDKHPEYLSSKYAIEYSEKEHIAVKTVQHHHAHIAACMIDNQLDINTSPIIGVAFDGLGFGEDGSLWGGEFLLCDYQQAKRLAHLKPVTMPGGTQAMCEPWRNTWAQLSTLFNWDELAIKHEKLALMQLLNKKPIKTLQQMMNKKLNSPVCTSAGRLFDAVAAATGLFSDECSFEGQAAIALENCIDEKNINKLSPYPFKLNTENSVYELDVSPMWESLLSNLQAKTASSIISTRFHLGLANVIVNTCLLLAKEHNVDQVALSGGVFQNRTLFELVVDGLSKQEINVLSHQQIPANDGGLALGQAVIAAARHIKEQATNKQSH